MAARWFRWALISFLLLPAYAAFLFAALLLAALPINSTRTCFRNLRERLKVGSVRAYFITTGVYLNYAFYAIDLLVYWPLGATIDVNLNEYFRFLDNVVEGYGLRSSRQGFLFLGGHYSAVEQAGGAMETYLRLHHIGEIYVLSKPSPSPVLTKVLDLYRTRRRFSVIWKRNAAQVNSEMKAALDRGHSMALVNDQKASKGGLFVEFFGAFASFPFKGIDLVKEHPVACVANNARRLLPGLFRMEFALMPNNHLRVTNPAALQSAKDSMTYTPALVLGSDHSPSETAPINTQHSIDPTVQQIMSHFVGWLEAVIRRSPHQWCWDYKKWSRRPE